MTAIHSRAMLARLSISQWTARKHDKAVSREVEKAHSAHDAGRFNKMLVNKMLLDPLARLAGSVRQYHYSVTLPWSDNGDRLLPAELFLEYTQQIRKFRDDFRAKTAELLAAYPTEVAAARNRLGTMYDPADYPEVSNLGKRFSIDTEFVPVPSANDFRVDVSDAAAEEIRASITASVVARQQEAVKECFVRIRDVVGKIHERLSISDAVFKDSLITNARDLMTVLPSLNITDDPVLKELHTEISTMLAVAPRTLRTSPSVRASTARAAQAILAKLP